MIKELPESEGSVLGVEITSKVSLEEEKEWIERFEKVIKKRGKISALVVLGEQASWGIDAGIEDLKWIMTHMKQFNKIAIVSERNVWKWLVAIDSPFARMVGIGEKYFELSELADAWKWVKE